MPAPSLSFALILSLLIQHAHTHTPNTSINYENPKRIHKVRIVLLLLTWAHIMKTQNNTDENPAEKRQPKEIWRQAKKNAEINKETSLLFPIQHRPFIIGNPLKWFISFKTWCMCINDLWISNNFRTHENQQKYIAEAHTHTEKKLLLLEIENGKVGIAKPQRHFMQ